MKTGMLLLLLLIGSVQDVEVVAHANGAKTRIPMKNADQAPPFLKAKKDNDMLLHHHQQRNKSCQTTRQLFLIFWLRFPRCLTLLWLKNLLLVDFKRRMKSAWTTLVEQRDCYKLSVKNKTESLLNWIALSTKHQVWIRKRLLVPPFLFDFQHQHLCKFCFHCSSASTLVTLSTLVYQRQGARNTQMLQQLIQMFSSVWDSLIFEGSRYGLLVKVKHSTIVPRRDHSRTFGSRFTIDWVGLPNKHLSFRLCISWLNSLSVVTLSHS